MTDNFPPLEQHHRPATTLRPHVLAWPDTFADVLAEYDRTHREWSLASHALHEAINAVPRAEAEDAAALTESVRAGGKVDPGGRADKARRAVSVEAERTAAAREAATRATDALKAAISGHGDELLPAVVETVRAAAEDYSRVLAEARGAVMAAAARLRDASSLPHLIRPNLSRAGLGVPDLGIPAVPSWPVDPTASVLARVDRLARDWERTSATTGASR